MGDKSIQALTGQLAVLLADGDHRARPAIRDALNQLGVKIVIEAADGLSAIEAFRTSEPDVAFLDLDLAIFGGLDAIQVIRARAPKAGVAASIFIMVDEARRNDVPASANITGVMTKGAGKHELARLLALAAQKKSAASS